jgi:hypothetical protein
LSHLLFILERYLGVFKFIAASDSGKNDLLQLASNIWTKDKRFLMIVVDKLLTYRILDPIHVSHWLLSPARSMDHAKGYIWEMLDNTMSKTVARKERAHTALVVAQQANLSNVDQLNAVYNQLASEQQAMFVTTFQNLVQLLDTPTLPWTCLWFKSLLIKYTAIFAEYKPHLDPLLTTHSSQDMLTAYSQVTAWISMSL